MVDNAFSGAGKDRITRLERLAALRNSGVLSEKEFEREKSLILEPEE
ncbi:MAG: SHOCT domain-containing protein [Candidatus Heimdallarchaeota archaeon]|nr:MAG: SHOCT domain-containing protein [Candidatus Heimdallarchaeota archaeon]